MTTTHGADRLPSIDLLRKITDQHVVDQLLANDALTRAQIAARTRISKPTISESVRRLVATGLLAEAGRQTGERGRSGTYYRLRADTGVALAISAGPEGVIAETCDVRGRLLDRVAREVGSPIAADELSPVLREVVSAAVSTATGPVTACSVSVAGPVDRRSGRLVRLPHAPFLLDELHFGRLLAEIVSAEVEIDNDVNWAALAEHRQGVATDLDQFCYCYLGPGLGGAVVLDGAVVHGHRGLAGEVAHVVTEGPGGRARRLVECFAAWGLLRAGTEAIDVPRVAAVLTGGTAPQRRQRTAIARAVAGALCSITAVLNPQAVVIGGPWASVGGFDELVADEIRAASAVAVEVRRDSLGQRGPLLGAQIQAVRAAQRSLVSRFT